MNYLLLLRKIRGFILAPLAEQSAIKRNTSTHYIPHKHTKSFKLISNSNGFIDFHPSDLITSKEAINDFFTHFRRELKIALPTQILCDAIQVSYFLRVIALYDLALSILHGNMPSIFRNLERGKHEIKS